jgi:uracil-DNA glycosylase
VTDESASGLPGRRLAQPVAAAATAVDRGTGSAADFLPSRLDVPSMSEAAQACRGCGLYQHATQAVFGEGPVPAPLMIVGEQPGDREDIAGHPFVGPAGRLLDTALSAAGIDRSSVYVTNAVKHFKWKRRSPGDKRRLHDRPDAYETRACRPWLEAEIAAVSPRLVVLLGATAAQAMLGSSARVTRLRGKPLPPAKPGGPALLVTIHPSAVLRADDREAELAALVADLTAAAGTLREISES